MSGTTTDARRTTRSATLSQYLEEADEHLRSHTATDARTIPTGFAILDEVLGGGLHAGDIAMLGGAPGVGKTIVALQWARNIAKAGGTAIFICYEHEPFTLMLRLLALEAGNAGEDRQLVRTMTEAFSSGAVRDMGLEEIASGTPHGTAALEALRSYADRMVIVQASGSHTTLDRLEAVIAEHNDPSTTCVAFVDYLQKIPIQPEPSTEAEKVTRTVEAVKDLALTHHLPMVLLSAVDAEGMRANRLRMFHLRGSSAVAFESDLVIMMNSKEKAVSKVHLSYDAPRARRFNDWVVFSIEKNRGGPNLIDVEFRKDFAHFRFDPDGGIVAEQLVSERFDESEL